MSNESKNSSEFDRVIPVIEEHLEIQKRQRVTGRVRLEKLVRTSNTVVDEELMRETISIERVSINRDLQEPAVMRQEGDTTIIPVMEEVVITSKKLVLREEIRITRQTEASRHQETVPLRVESVRVERLGSTPERGSLPEQDRQ